MKTKNIFRVFLTAAFVLGTMAINAQTKVYVYKSDGTSDEYNIANVDSISFNPKAVPPTPTEGNLLGNPGFEDPDNQTDDLPSPWKAVEQSWFTDYYSGFTMSGYGAGNRVGLTSTQASPAGTIFFNANAASIWNILTGSYCGRLALSNTAGIYQEVDVTPGAIYNFSVRVALTTTNTNGVIQDNNTVKILDANNPLQLIKEVPIPTDNQIARTECGNPNPTGCGATTGVFIAPMTITGTVTIPAGITKIRFQLDQRDYANVSAGGLGRAPLLLFDDCVFSKEEN